MIRVLVADDDAFFRCLVATVLGNADDIEIVGEAHDGPEAVRLARKLQPHVVLLDVTMAGGGGIEAARELHGSVEGVAVVMLTGSGENSDVQACLRAGAKGYMLKPSFGSLAAVIRTVGEGVGVLLSSSVARNLADDQDEGGAGGCAVLTGRELEVLRLIAKGLTNDDIAGELWLSSHTIKRHVANILAKLEVRTRWEAVNRAVAEGILPWHEAAG